METSAPAEGRCQCGHWLQPTGTPGEAMRCVMGCQCQTVRDRQREEAGRGRPASAAKESLAMVEEMLQTMYDNGALSFAEWRALEGALRHVRENLLNVR